ncbi:MULTISPECIES: transcriptional regulator NrdR [Burkholderiaceae]|uniref:transcriptional regulator NrdR n=1 Tax=Burkholderiaceae TaxID=119060 RepID=UPI0009616FF1|nr:MULTISPECIES: transcriptional regulator NrdR [Burkholderiaceae]MCF2134175.1 transcriptional regulator NrdR [Mycetohabitans sp. B3]MCG1018950.1 transcriptional regulator NrdR [Mycetohabitans sp. B4]MCG1039725.1 transcriptional regulator NrdR [Mycetohabitans sp. B7]SIT70815.1 transcriptional repressor NrdR [Burkholderia sp. b14]SIT73994.1 transcriptional repressor NrdR [Burkholderia sp. b13]
MRCPFCRHDDTQVVDSRVSEDGAAIRRRRRCPACDKRFTTYERVELALPTVVKKDGTRVEFDRRKILSSMQLALRKRPVAAEAIDEAVARVEYQLLASGEREVRSERLGELVMDELRKLDKIAYVRFASVYKRFEDVSEFKNLIDEFGRSAAGTSGSASRKRQS